MGARIEACAQTGITFRILNFCGGAAAPVSGCGHGGERALGRRLVLGRHWRASEAGHRRRASHVYRAGARERVKDRIAQTESVRAALVFVARGEAPLGIVYRSDAHAERHVKVLGTFPESSHPPIVYPIAMIAGSTSADAKAFYDYLSSPAAAAMFEREAFEVLRKAAAWPSPPRNSERL